MMHYPSLSVLQGAPPRGRLWALLMCSGDRGSNVIDVVLPNLRDEGAETLLGDSDFEVTAVATDVPELVKSPLKINDIEVGVRDGVTHEPKEVATLHI